MFRANMDRFNAKKKTNVPFGSYYVNQRGVSIFFYIFLFFHSEIVIYSYSENEC